MSRMCTLNILLIKLKNQQHPNKPHSGLIQWTLWYMASRFRNWEAVHLGGSGSGFSHLRLQEPLQAGWLTWQLAGGPTSSSCGPLRGPRNTQLASSRGTIPESQAEAAVLFMTCSGKSHTCHFCHILLVRNELLGESLGSALWREAY